MAVSSRERTSQRSTWPVQSLALETHWRASAVLSIASSAAGTKRTRSCSPTALPSPRQADNFFFFFFPPPGPQGRPVTAVNKRRNTNLARETRTLCPVGQTSLIPWVSHQSYWVTCYRSSREAPHRCEIVFVEYHTAAPYKKPRMRCSTTRVF